MFKDFLVFLSIFIVFCPPHIKAQITTGKAESKKVDIILLQDESGSMKLTDPHQIRKHVATFLIEDLEVAGEGNRMALILFGAQVVERVPLSRDFNKIKEASEQAFTSWKGPFDFDSLNNVNPILHTDIYGALTAAKKILENEQPDPTSATPSAQKEKHVILLTDGKLDPWPGNAQRYGSISAEYQRCLKDANHTRCTSKLLNRVSAIDTENLFVKAGLLAEFKKNGWRVHCLGFSSGVDVNLLEQISAATYGHAGIATDHTQLLQILEQIIPPAPNVVTLLIRDFCKTRIFEDEVAIENEVKAVQFKIDLNLMLKQNASIRPGDLKIVLTDPKGRKILSKNNEFRFNTTNRGLIVTASYFQKDPQPGTWHIRVEGVGSDVCGKLQVTGHVPFVPEMVFKPEMSGYFQNQKVGITVSLKNSETGSQMPLEGVSGKFRISPEDGSRIMERDLDFGLSGDGQTAAASLQIPENVKGKGAIETTIVDRKYRSQTKHFRSINIEGRPEDVQLTTQPESIDLGTIGDVTNTVRSDPIRISTTAPFQVEVEFTQPKLVSGIHEIPISWVKIEPSGGEVQAAHPIDISLAIGLPTDVSLAFPQGVYKGQIIIEPVNFKGSSIIPVELQIKVPEIVTDPSNLKFDFWWRLGTPITKSIEIGHTSKQDRVIRLDLPRKFKDRNNNVVEIQEVEATVMKEKSSEWQLEMGDVIKVPVSVSIKNLSFKKGQRLPKGKYIGTARISGEGINPKEIALQIDIPDKPALVEYGRPASLLLMYFCIFLSFLGFLLLLIHFNKDLFNRTYHIEFDHASGVIKPKHRKKFKCVFLKVAGPDGEYTIGMPSQGNKHLMIEDPYTEEGWIQFPDEGIKDIENWKGEPLMSIKNQIKSKKYVYKKFKKSKTLEMVVVKSPYGSVGGYTFKKVVIWFFLSALSAGIAYWFYHIT